MSLTKDAIQHLQASANIPAIIDQLSEFETEIPTITMPDSMSVHSLEKYMTHASRYRSNYTTTSIEDFFAYNALFDAKGAICFVNAEQMSAKSIFDLGTLLHPGHKENTARLSLNKTAAFQALHQINGTKLSQKSAAEFLEDWADFIAIFNKQEADMTIKAAANALLNLTIEAAKEVTSNVSDFGASQSLIESIEAKHQDQIPAEFTFTCSPYLGLIERSFTLRVSILTAESKPLIVFRILQLEALEEDIAEEFKKKLSDAFIDLELKTFIGAA